MNLPVKTLFSCLLAFPLWAQEPGSGFSLHDAGLGFGFQFRDNAYYAEENWEQIPGFHNYHADSSGYEAGSYLRSELPDWKTWNLHVHFRILPKSSLNWIFGVHVQYNDAIHTGISYWRSAETWWDPNDTDTFFVHKYVFSADRLSICPRLVLSSDPEKRFGGYYGLQLSFGMSTNARMDVSHEERGYSPDHHQLTYGPPPLLHGDYSTHYLKQVQTLGIGVPAGLTFLAGRSGSLLSHLAVSLEGSESIWITRIPDMKKTFAKSSFQAGLRLSYRL